MGERKREEAEIPTASMADIAFLLLIFFLVTTTIDVDTGIGMVLPPPLDPEQQPPPIKERNMLKVLVNEEGEVLVEDQPTPMSKIKEIVIKHITNFGQDPRYAEDPNKAIVSVKTARKTPYEIYVKVLDEIRKGYLEVRDAEARKLGYPNYATYKAKLDDPDQDVIRKKFPMKISIAEPDPGT